MDIRSIIDAEDVPAVRKPAPVLGKSESQPLPANMSSPHTTQAPDYPERRDRRPPQPSPLQPPLYNDLRSPNDSSYNKVGNSPYQPTSSSSLSSGQYPFPQHPSQSPGYGYQNSQYTQRDSYSASSALGHPSLGHSTPLSQTPTASTPGSANAYSSFPRPTSSHSISTPTSVQPPSFLRGIGGSPQSSGGRTLSQPHPSQQLYAGSPISYSSRTVYPGDHLNHNGQERERSTSVSPKTRVQSLPGNEVWNASSERARAVSDQFTPAKRKIIEQISDNAESTEQVMRQPPRRMVSVGINEMLNAEPASKATEKEAQPQKQYFTTDTSNTALSDPDLISWKSSLSQSSSQAFPTLRSFSNTPYTQPPVPHGPLPVQRASMQPQTPTPPASERQTLAKPEKSSSPNVEMARAFKGDNLATSKLLHDPQSQPPAKRARREGPPTAGSNHSNPEVKIDAQETVPSLLSQPVKAEHLEDWQNAKSLLPPSRTSKISNSSKSPSQPFRKKTRRQPIPIFAQSILGDAHQQPTNHRPRSTNRAAPVTATQANAHTQINGTSLPVLQPTPAINGPLGPWEPSILNVIPSEELVKMVSDFLFREVVTRDDVGVGPAGGLATQGAVLEIEAKIGQLVSKDTNDRLRMAAITECIVSQADPSLRYTFQSSMTESQHRAMNRFLNKAVGASKIPPRIPMDYKHTHETDTFYELSQTGALALPRSIATQLGPRHKTAKIRITTDQKTGVVVAKIVKARVADIDIYSPRTPFDWRISVNVEMNFEGDMKELVEMERGRDGRRSDRNKDRMSYTHLAYQIDLTQVTAAEGGAGEGKEHELEVEVSSAEVRRQGLLAQRGEESRYQELITGFVDNVRLLARQCQPAS